MEEDSKYIKSKVILPAKGISFMIWYDIMYTTN